MKFLGILLNSFGEVIVLWWGARIKSFFVGMVVAIGGLLMLFLLGLKKGKSLGIAKVEEAELAKLTTELEKVNAASMVIQKLPEGRASLELENKWTRQ